MKPNTRLPKLHQLAEGLKQLEASTGGIFTATDKKQADLVRRLQEQDIVPRYVEGLFASQAKANVLVHLFATDDRLDL